MPRFVVLLHELPADSTRATHWDFMLEDGECLLTWALEAEPDSTELIRCEALAEHRKDYLDYEGPISRDRGSVLRWDEGTFCWTSRLDDTKVAALRGARLCGDVKLTDQGDHWQFQFFPSD